MNEGINKAYKIKKITNDCDWLYVRHDDLHLNLKLTIYKVASFLGIVESETLLKNTLGGKEWSGNSSFGRVISGPNKEVIERWKKTIKENEKYLIECNFEKEMKEHSYDFIFHKKTKLRKIFNCFIPCKNEFKIILKKNKPENLLLSTIWSFFSKIDLFFEIHFNFERKIINNG